MGEIAATLAGSFQRAPWGWALLVTVIVALIRVWPALSKQAMESRLQVRTERRSDLGDCQRRLDEMGKRVDGLEEKLHQTDLKLLGAISAYRILDAEVESRDPGSTALSQARLVMSAAFTMSPSTEEAQGRRQ
jgi:hypothetical protein